MAKAAKMSIAALHPSSSFSDSSFVDIQHHAFLYRNLLRGSGCFGYRCASLVLNLGRESYGH